MTFHCWLTRIFKLTRQNAYVYLYLIKLAQHKNANLILTRKCFTIAIKTIQLSSHIIKHDEFIKATFSSMASRYCQKPFNFLETSLKSMLTPSSYRNFRLSYVRLRMVEFRGKSSSFSYWLLSFCDLVSSSRYLVSSFCDLVSSSSDPVLSFCDRLSNSR